MPFRPAHSNVRLGSKAVIRRYDSKSGHINYNIRMFGIPTKDHSGRLACNNSPTLVDRGDDNLSSLRIEQPLFSRAGQVMVSERIYCALPNGHAD